MKSTIKAIIIDDEKACISNLQYNLLTYCPDIDIVATGESISDVRHILLDTPFDVAFFDVKLFDDNIFELLCTLNTINFKIVFVTAYDKYAINAFKVDALDYLLKPLYKEDILACYDKIKKWFVISGQVQELSASKQELSRKEPTIALRQGDKIYVVTLLNVLYLEAKGFYTKVCFLHNGIKREILISKLLTHAAREYSAEYFFRVHKSYIVNTRNLNAMIKHGSMTLEMKTGDIIPVAKRRVSEFITYMQSKQVVE